MIGCTIYHRVHWRVSARKVTHLNIILSSLGNLTLQFPQEPSSGLGFQIKTSIAHMQYTKMKIEARKEANMSMSIYMYMKTLYQDLNLRTYIDVRTTILGCP